mmetsp:Transcript_89689/g.175527  ORF Transcript_89689/g.175527 Transcript_89689/m.175527 type:complete len:155 (+) Transcript_89689:41-505(+)
MLREEIEKLTKELASKAQELEEAKKDQYATETSDVDEQLAAVQTELVIARSEFEQAMETMQTKVVEKEAELESVRNSMGERIEKLEEEMEKAKKEYQESIQALAATFQQRVEQTGRVETNAEAVATGNGTDIAITKSPSFGSDNDDEFKDCVDS